MWDLKAKLLGLPLHRLLGGVRDDVLVYGSGGFTCYDEDQLRDQLSGWASGQHIPRPGVRAIAVATLAFCIAYRLAEDNLIVPRIMGRQQNVADRCVHRSSPGPASWTPSLPMGSDDH